MNALEKLAAKKRLTDRLKGMVNPASGAALGTALGYRLGLPGIVGGAALGAHLGKKKGVQYQGSPAKRAALAAPLAGVVGGLPFTSYAMRELAKKGPDAAISATRTPAGRALMALAVSAPVIAAALAARSAKPK